jgi:hypothetical protein
MYLHFTSIYPDPALSRAEVIWMFGLIIEIFGVARTWSHIGFL